MNNSRQGDEKAYSNHIESVFSQGERSRTRYGMTNESRALGRSGKKTEREREREREREIYRSLRVCETARGEAFAGE